MIDISQTKFDASCPKCNAKINITLQQIEQQAILTCSECNSKINLVDKNGNTQKAINDINKGFKNLQNTIKIFGK